MAERAESAGSERGDEPTLGHGEQTNDVGDVEARVALERVAQRLVGRRRWVNVGRYEVVESIGRGGCGVVFAAHDPNLDRDVAIKLVLPRGDAEPRSLRWHERLVREARALAAVRHPNVVEIFDVGVHDQAGEVGVYLVMERVRGRMLSEWVSVARPGWSEILDAYVQAARGLVAAHEAGLVHRDFKPQNAMVDDDGTVRVLDFGLVHALDGPSSAETSAGQQTRSDQSLTETGIVLGTPIYMAPEQHGGGTISPATDVFAWSVSVYHALYGEPPFLGASPEEIGEAKRKGRISPLPARSHVPRWVGRIIQRGLAANPRARPELGVICDSIERRRRQWVLPAAVATAAAAAIAAAAAFGAPDVCPDDERRARDLWSADSQQRVLGAFARAGLPGGESVRGQLDRYVQRWESAYETGCAVRNAPARSCLSRRVEHLDHIISTVADGDAKALRRVGPIFEGLDSPEACLDLPADAPQRTQEQADEIAALHGRADRIGTAIEAETVEENEAWLEEALERAVVLGDPELTSKLYQRRGQLKVRRGDFEGAATDAREAVWTAMTAGDDRRALAALPLLLDVVADGLQDRERAWAIAEKARTWITRLGDPPGALALHLTITGQMLAEEGRTDEAYERLAQANRHYESQENPGRWHALCLVDLASVEIDREHLAEASAHQQRALEVLELGFGAADPNYATAMSLAGEIAHIRGENDDAVRLYRRAVELQAARYGAEHPKLAWPTAFLGALEARAGRTEIGLELLDRGEKIARDAGAPPGLIADIQHNRREITGD